MSSQCWRLVFSSPNGQDHLSEVRSLDRGLNSTLESIAKRVVRDLEEGSRARVIQATLDFILQPSTTAKVSTTRHT